MIIFTKESIKLQEKFVPDTKERRENLISSNFLLLLGLVHFSSSTYRYVTYGFFRQQLVIKRTTPKDDLNRLLVWQIYRVEDWGGVGGKSCRDIYFNGHIMKGQPS